MESGIGNICRNDPVFDAHFWELTLKCHVYLIMSQLKQTGEVSFFIQGQCLNFPLLNCVIAL